ncbi:MAG: hypothetical protein KDK64_07125 [Chlamydiia bacterium]|nr:hypothetical protein [Chlamydiia bacterium]
MKSILLFLFPFAMLTADVTYVYNKDVEGRESKTTWTLDFKESDDTLHIIGESTNGKTLIVTSPDRVTKSFRYENTARKDQYSVHREGDTLIAIRDADGERIQKHFRIGDSAWVQEFDFCFKPFILSGFHDFKFSIVHPKKLSLHDMVATKQGFEPIEVHGKQYDALKVKVTLTGFKKMFWHADLWFDPQAGDLLKYMANEGPNTPLSTITLFSKQVAKSP